MKRDPVSVAWIAGLVLAVLFYLLDPGLVAERVGAVLSVVAGQLDLVFAQLTFAAADAVRALALALYAVFCILCVLSVQRGGRGYAALLLVSAAFVGLVGWDGTGPGERRWGEALLLAGVGALVMTRRVRGGVPARLR